MEHHSNLLPWQQVTKLTGARLELVPLTGDGRLDLAAFERILRSGEVRLVAVTAVSNVLGTINPIERIVALAHAAGALVLVDGAQSVPHMPCDVQAWDCDFLAFSSHKMCGPDGVGVLYGKLELLESMPPFQTGGEMVKRVEWHEASWNDVPWKFEAGTPPIGPAIGLGAAVEFLQRVGLQAIAAHDAELAAECWHRLAELPGVRLLGPGPEHRSAVVSFVVDGIHPHDLAQVLDSRGVAIRAGHHCAQPLHRDLGLFASARASFYLYNTVGEIGSLIEAVQHAQRLFRRR